MLRNFLLISALFLCLIIFSAFSSNPCSQLGDANCDGIVNLSDLTLVINNWLQVTAVGNNGDVVGSEDGFVNLDDLTLVINNWLEVTSTLVGCTDSTALNYDSLATVDNGECFSCVDSLLQNDTVININDSINLFDINLFTSGIGVYDIDSNFYPSVAINNQEWTIENLKTTRFSNGDLIPNVTDGTIWQSLTTEAWCYWGNSIGNNAAYGKLYNWYTVSGSRNLCPINWRIPTKSDIDTLINFSQDPTTAGGALKESGYSNWPYPNVGATNSSGFTGLPGGYRADNGNFYNIGIGYSNSNCSGDCIVNVPNRQGMYWSSDPVNNGWPNDSVYGYSINLHSQLAQLSGTVQNKASAVSVRCVRSLPKFLWSTGDTTSSITVSPNQTTTFWLIKIENGISCIDSVTITVLISGCTDSTATNFDPIANTDDGSCIGIGDTYQGGIIFYLDGNGGGLVAAPSDQSSSAEWGCIGTDISGADGVLIGTGVQNTVDIELGCSTSGIAADLCANLTLGGYSDWYLPSKEELDEMWSTIGIGSGVNLANFANGPYWSSTEYYSGRAWKKLFNGSGLNYQNHKFIADNIRAVRAF